MQGAASSGQRELVTATENQRIALRPSETYSTRTPGAEDVSELRSERSAHATCPPEPAVTMPCSSFGL